MMFNPDLTKQAQEVIFSRKTVKPFHPHVFFNEVPVKRCVSQKKRKEKDIGLHLNQKLDFSKHINETISKAQKEISVIKKLKLNKTIRVFQTKSKRFSCNHKRNHRNF